MRIAFLIRSLTVGGSERQLVNLAAGLRKRGHAVSVISFYGGGAFAEELEREGVSILTLEKSGRWDLLRFGRSLRRAIKSADPEVIYSFLPVPNLVAAFARMTLSPRPALVWGVRSASVTLSHYDRVTRLVYAMERRLSWLPDCIVANSWAAQEEWRGVRPLHVIPNGIDVGRFTIDRAAGRHVREEFGIAGDAVLIGDVGRLDPIKDHGTFVRAAARIAQSAADARFLVVGGGDEKYRDNLKRLAAESAVGGLIVWAGERNDMPAVYNALDLLVSSSASEAFPNVVAEAMACGIPCVVTDVGDCRRIVADETRVVPPGDPEKLASTIRRVLRSDASVSPEERRRHIVASFSIDTMIERTETLLLKVGQCSDREPAQGR